MTSFDELSAFDRRMTGSIVAELLRPCGNQRCRELHAVDAVPLPEETVVAFAARVFAKHCGTLEQIKGARIEIRMSGEGEVPRA